jgi:hypothetical protein
MCKLTILKLYNDVLHRQTTNERQNVRKLIICNIDSLDSILKAATANTSGLCRLQLENDVSAIREFFRGTKALMYEIDKQMTTLCLDLDDQEALTNWASRMQTICKHLDIIERNLPHANTRLFDWDSVLESMGLVLAFRVGAEFTISANETS